MPSSIKKVPIILFASVGGHLDQLLDLVDGIKHECLLIIDEDKDFPENFPFDYCVLRTSERYKIWMNTVLCFRILLNARPKVILTTGSGSCILFFCFGKIFGSKCIFVESIARIQTLSLSARLARFITPHVYVQWPSLADKYKLKYAGKIKSKHEY